MGPAAAHGQVIPLFDTHSMRVQFVGALVHAFRKLKGQAGNRLMSQVIWAIAPHNSTSAAEVWLCLWMVPSTGGHFRACARQLICMTQKVNAHKPYISLMAPGFMNR